jgi:uncharacterized protein YgiM (DUF1202 family)
MKRIILAGLAMAVIGTAARAEDVWIKRAAEVRSEQGPVGDTLASVVKGQKVHVLERSGDWVRVDAGGQIGWVAADSVSSREVKRDSGLIGGSSGAEMSSGAAIKGLEPIAEDYRRTRNLSTAGVDEMIRIHKSVSGKMLKDFMTEGGIEPARKGRKPDSK